MIELLSWIGADDKLVYSSDYPHWDADDLDYLCARLPRDWLGKVLRENAMRLYGWSEADLPAPAARATGE
jgi:predicted TIM-barrel fold metal-dependent hydrolase